MENSELFSYIDHTQLKAFATWEDIRKLCDEAVRYGTASVCVPPCYIKRIHEAYGDKINICTVVGFPLGYSVTEAKAAEVKKALEDGANEIDMVVNISDVKNGNYPAVEAEIKALKEAAGRKILDLLPDGRGKDRHVPCSYECRCGFYQNFYRFWNRRSNHGGYQAV